MKVDIIMRTKDRPIFLERAIKDVMAQSYKQWHLCIVNDSPNKKTVEDIVKKSKLDKNKLTLIHNTKKIPQDALINVGIKNTKNELIVVHDDDDTWHPDFLKKCVARLQESIDYADIGGVVTKVDRVYEKIKEDKIKKLFVLKHNYDNYYNNFQHPFFHIEDVLSRSSSPFYTIAFVYRRRSLNKVGMYDEKLPVLGDMDFNFRFIMNFDVAFIDEALAYYHRRATVRKGEQSNSIYSGGINFYNPLIINKYIRSDVKKGNLGLGSAIIQAQYFAKLKRDLKFYHLENRFYNKFKIFLKRCVKKLIFRS